MGPTRLVSRSGLPFRDDDPTKNEESISAVAQSKPPYHNLGISGMLCIMTVQNTGEEAWAEFIDIL